MKTTKNRKNLLIHIVLIAGIAVTVFPFLWMIFTSFKTLPESMQIPPTILPEKIIWDSYKYVFDVLPFAQIYVNTIIITVLTVLFQVAFCTMAAYGFARIEFPFKNAIFIVLLAILMVPGQIFLIPQYLIIQNLGLVNTLPGLFLPNLFSAFGTFLLRQFFMSLPKELEEAALLDGCNRFQIFGKIALPLSKPLMATIALFLTFGYWNDWFQSSLYISDTKLYSLQALLDHVQRNIEMMANNPSLGVTTAQYMNSMPKEGARMAMAIIIIIPIACCYPFFQKYFISGLTVGAVKG